MVRSIKLARPQLHLVQAEYNVRALLATIQPTTQIPADPSPSLYTASPAFTPPVNHKPRPNCAALGGHLHMSRLAKSHLESFLNRLPRSGVCADFIYY